MRTRPERMAAKGWVRRGAAAEPRLGELVDRYRELGFAVRLEPFSAEELRIERTGGCRTCFEEDPGRFRVIYTRSRPEAADGRG